MNPLLLATASHFGIPVHVLLRKHGSAHVRHARSLCIYLMRESGMKYEEIGRAMNRHHTTAISGYERVAEAVLASYSVEFDSVFDRQMLADLEAIRRRAKETK